MIRRPRCIVIDPNQRFQHSHNYRYNKIICNNAIEAGFDTVLLINKTDNSDFSDVTADIRKCFSHSSYDYAEIHSKYRNIEIVNLCDGIFNFGRSVAGLLRPGAAARFPDVVSVFNIFLRTIMVILFPFIYILMKLYNFIIYKRAPYYDDLFARELAAELRKLKVSEGDLVIMHSGNYAMIEALFFLRPHMDLIDPLPAPLHVVFHHSMTENYGESFNLDYYQRAEPRWLGQRCRSGLPFRALHLFGTNDGLCSEMTALSGLPFKIFNHVEEPAKFSGRLADAEARSPNRTVALRVGVRAKDITAENHAAVALAFKAVRAKDPDSRFVLLGLQSSSSNDVQRLLLSVHGIEVADIASDSDYLDQIAGLDLLLQPYRQADYTNRISAVFAECALLGVAVVAPDNTTMSRSAHLGHVFTYSEIDDLAAAATDFVDAHRTQDFARERLKKMKEAREIFLRNCVTQDFLPAAAEPAVTCGRFGAVAAVVSPFWGKCGSTTVFDSNTEYLLSRGFFVFRMMVSENPAGYWNIDSIFQRHRENSERVRPHAFLLASSTRASTLKVFLSPSFWRKSLFGQLNALNGGAVDHDRTLARYVFENAVVVIVNHAFNTDYARRFRKARIILETQDIQARQLASQRRRNLVTQRIEREADHLRDEIAVWRSVDATVNLSETENATIRSYSPRSTCIRPYMAARRISPKRPWAEFVATNRLDPAFLDRKSFDLMLWGDAHPLNVQSAIWFLEKVVLAHPRLADKSVVVVGRLGPAVYANLGPRPRWYYGDFLDTMDDCFAKARLLVLPDQIGTGMSIKTLETLAIGMPFVATAVAMRGINLGDTNYVPAGSVAEFQQDILQLLRLSASRKKRAELAKYLFSLNFDREFYCRAWDEVLASVGLPQ
ncbi:glycosyltransferase [Roseomonas rosulenta]|uniref:glycosyltransferase n=1 Tax=Roseomonas rosulenta TaxID=2748667 RepID=UPI0018DEF8F5